MKCARVLLKDAEDTRRKLASKELIDKRYRILSGKKYVYIPVVKNIHGFNIVDKKLNKRDSSANNLMEVLEDILESGEISLFKRAHDVIGDVAVIEIDDRLLKKKKIIADAFRKVHKNIRSVARKIGMHEGKYRIQKYEVISGDKNLETIHRENGVILKLDIGRVYFSPRLAAERLRVARCVKKDENVLVMFSGAGIYCLVIAKHSKANEIYGVEINPYGHKYALESLKLNKFRNVKFFPGDVRRVVPKFEKKFDRIIMPLPASSLKFLDLGLKYIKNKGIIHLYFFSDEAGVRNVLDFIKKKCKCRILRVARCGQQSPKVYRWCADFKVYRP